MWALTSGAQFPELTLVEVGLWQRQGRYSVESKALAGILLCSPSSEVGRLWREGSVWSQPDVATCFCAWESGHLLAWPGKAAINFFFFFYSLELSYLVFIASAPACPSWDLPYTSPKNLKFGSWAVFCSLSPIWYNSSRQGLVLIMQSFVLIWVLN